MTMQKIHFDHWHRPDRHRLMHRMSELLHDSRFWAVLLIVAVFAMVLTIAAMFAGDGRPTTGMPYGYPIFPHYGF